MPGNRIGGQAARDTILKKNPNFYREIGQKGGLRKVKKGFATNLELASAAGKRGGSISRREKSKRG